jgi:drug/metabolite transporter (DMT)-like permease
MINTKKAYTYAFLAIAFWGTAATAFKLTLNYLSFIQLLAISSYTSCLIFLILLLYQKKHPLIFNQNLKTYSKAAFLGLLNPFGYYLVLFKAYSLIPAQIAQPLNFIWPLVLVILSIPILKHKVTKYNFIGLTVSFIGVLVISTKGNINNLNIDSPFGIMLAAGSSIIWALYWIMNMNSRIDTILALFLNFAFSSFYISMLVLITGNTYLADFRGLLGGIYVGIFEMGITFILWMKALNYAGSAARIGNLIYITPFLSLIWIHFVLGEQIYITTFAGLGLIIAGIFINKASKKQSLPSEQKP